MGLFYAVNIQNDTAAVLLVRKERSTYEILENKVLKPSEITHFSTKKRSIYASIDQDDVLNENINIPTAIKKDNVIQSMILRKFSNIIQNRKIILNYHILSENSANNTTMYQVDGVYEDDYVDTLHTLEKLGEIKSTTSGRFALLGLSEQCIKDESYLTVYTQSNKVEILAVHKGLPIFNRVVTIVTNSLENQQTSIVNEISTTITYVNRLFHDIEFSTIALSGSIAMDEIVSEHLYTLIQIPITVLYPNTFMLGLPNEKAQHFILALGSYFVPKSCQFLPLSLVGAHQYRFLQNMLLVASIIILLFISFLTYEKYESYNETLEQYESIKDRLIQMVRKTDTYAQEDLQYSLRYLQIGEKYFRYHPSDLLLALKPLIMLQKPEHFNWEYYENEPKFSVTFAKPFESLDALYQFEKRFQKQFNNIKTTQPLTFLNQTDYVNMQFKGIVSMEKTKEAMPVRTTRRRR